jgi:hypothetical protein
MEKVNAKQNSDLRMERELKNLFANQVSETGANTDFEDSLYDKLISQAEKINSEKGLAKQSSTTEKQGSFLQIFAISFASFVTVLVIAGGIAMYFYVQSKNTGPDIASNGGDLTENNDNNIGTNGETSLGSQTLVKPTDKAVICEDICDPKIALGAIKAKFADLYSFQATLQINNNVTNFQDNYVFYVNREINTRVVKTNYFEQNPSDGNIQNISFFQNSQLAGNYADRSDADLIRILAYLGGRYTGEPKMSLSKSNSGKVLTLEYSKNSVKEIKMDIYTDGEFSPSSIYITQYDSNGSVTQTYTFQYTNFNVANSFSNEQIPSEYLAISSVEELQASIKEREAFKFFGDFIDNSQNGVNYREWGNVSRVSEDRYNADLKTYSKLGLYEHMLLSDSRYIRQFDFTNYAWGSYSDAVMNEEYLDGYAVDFSAFYVLNKYASNSDMILDFNSKYLTAENLVQYTVMIEGGTKLVICLDSDGYVVRQNVIIGSDAGYNAKMNYFLASNPQEVTNSIQRP